MYKTVKRSLDTVGALIAITILSPILALTCVAIRLDSPGPAIFRQTRLGLNGEPFTMLKFRSMTVGAESGGVYESAGDPRVTRVGRIIRKTSIDELPQFLNIIRGEMSLIGPRPTLEYHPWPIKDYSDAQFRRFLVRPGITGWAQVQGRKTVAWDTRLKYDVEYVDRMSLSMDVRIFFRTIVQTLSNADNVNVSETAPSGKSDNEAGSGEAN